MEGKKNIKKHTLFLIMLLAYVLSIASQFIENGDLEPFAEETAAAPGLEGASYEYITSFSDGKVNINTASKSMLDTLEGIGAEYAERIIKYREESGKFEVIEEIMKVPGIGEKRFLKIKDKISVE